MEEFDPWESDWESEAGSNEPLYPVVQQPEPQGELRIGQPVQEVPSASGIAKPIPSLGFGHGGELPQRRQAISEPTGDILEDERKRRKDIEKRLQDRIDELERVLKAQAIVSTQTVRNLSSLSKKVSSVKKDTGLRPQEIVELQERPQEMEGQSKKSQNVWTLEGAHQKEEPRPSAPPMPEDWRFMSPVEESKRNNIGHAPFQVHIKPHEPPLFTSKKAKMLFHG